MRRVKDLLRSREATVHGIQQTGSVHEAVVEFLDKKISSLAVYDGERLAGIFTKNDLVRCCHRQLGDLSKLKVGEAMKRDVFTSTPDADLDEVLAVMVEGEFRHVPVVENGRAIGMLTSQDILVHQHELVQVEREEIIRYVRDGY